jgi:hypothetical protein
VKFCLATPAAEDAEAMMDSPRPLAVFVNDCAAENARYRRPVMDLLATNMLEVHSTGLFDGPVSFAKSLRYILDRRTCLIVSSNLRANLLLLLFPFLPAARTVFIINGFGRFHKLTALRWLIRAAISRRRRCGIIVQSYADYRYLRRFAARDNLHWLPGSGGRRKHYGKSVSRVVVQRDRKIALVAPDINRLFDQSPSDRQLIVVGCKSGELVKGLFPKISVRCTGVVPTDAIFQHGREFLQPSGYGEGVPHTLVDAIASDVPTLISDKEYLRYGLYRIGARRRPICSGWSRLESSPALRQNVSEANIAQRTVDLCLRRATSPTRGMWDAARSRGALRSAPPTAASGDRPR